MRKRNKRPKKKKTLLGKFFAILLSILAIYFILLGSYVVYTHVNDSEDDNITISGLTNTVIDAIKPTLPDRTNVLLLGIDDDGTARTDTIMIASYNTVANEIVLISIPRDTRVNYNGKTVKVNSIHATGDFATAGERTLKEVEKLLGINLDYYVRVDFDGFVNLIDEIDGVEYDVPMRMKYYDPDQNLRIDLQPGLQKLDGDKAIQLVRFRSGYANADLQRVQVQQDFMKEALLQTLSKEKIMSNPTAYLTTLIRYVDTNATVTDGVKYMMNISDINKAKFLNFTLPGEARYIGDVSYFLLDEEESSKLMYELFKAPAASRIEEEEPNENEENLDSKDKEIQVLNGGYTSGFAGKTAEKLEAKGFTVADIDDFEGSKKAKTRIYVSKDGLGKDLAELFDEPEIIKDLDMTSEYDIVIVIGTNEKS